MTDGIIQEAFNKAKGNWLNVIVGDNDVLCIPLSVVNELQQELIEKIKQEFQAYHYNESGLSFNEIRKILMGDNKE